MGESAVEDVETEDVTALREEGDLPVFIRLRIHPARSPVQVVALWQRFPAAAGHTTGAWPSATPLGTEYQRAPGEAVRCDCARCRALATAGQPESLPLPSVRVCSANGCRTSEHGTRTTAGLRGPR